MSEPLVVAVLLTKDRPAMARRAIESFRAQTYKRASLMIFDTSTEAPIVYDYQGILHHWETADNRTVGALRNDANGLAGIAKTPKEIDIFVHWDSDDWSHPNRIAEQVALLQASGADCVGYREMLFWRMRELFDEGVEPYEAWIYRNHRSEYAVGTSLMYWRKTWERKPFKRIPHSQTTGREDSLFIQGLKMATRSSILEIEGPCRHYDHAPRMIASIHAGNLNPYNPEASPSTWRRAPEFDQYCKEKMSL